MNSVDTFFGLVTLPEGRVRAVRSWRWCRAEGETVPKQLPGLSQRPYAAGYDEEENTIMLLCFSGCARVDRRGSLARRGAHEMSRQAYGRREIVVIDTPIVGHVEDHMLTALLCFTYRSPAILHQQPKPIANGAQNAHPPNPASSPPPPPPRPLPHDLLLLPRTPAPHHARASRPRARRPASRQRVGPGPAGERAARCLGRAHARYRGRGCYHRDRCECGGGSTGGTGWEAGVGREGEGRGGEG
ncbi:uncharacterized protein EV422DRAFT_60371 [Fimicolochytrium jonesii]|uniref:uncharacterized protein n=1 Tax=Fimicolochytrium jonesii TaxID=1396493 RepID=UPI0022FE62DA|nr:uncharacterized protein EV422DRAFT_60371 [Fimicolochytrium jonesii]KAI8820711.1 hypothetical protein EV422DRAFT_60371 [Fimicolochytrium jonesii]